MYKKRAEMVRPWASYAGGKSKYLPQLMRIIPEGINTFVDMYGGTGVVGTNTWNAGKCKRLIYNDIEWDMARLVEILKLRPLDKLIHEQEDIADKYYGTKSELAGPADRNTWALIRHDYNESIAPLYLDKNWAEEHKWNRYTRIAPEPGASPYWRGGRLDLLLFLVRSTYNGMPQWDREGEYTGRTGIPNGKTRRTYHMRDYDGMADYSAVLHESGAEIYSVNATSAYIDHDTRRMSYRAPEEVARFKEILRGLGADDFVYLDPPYLNSGVKYSGWTMENEIYLASMLFALDKQGVRWLLSNNLQYGNDILRYLARSYYCWITEESYAGINKKQRTGKTIDKKSAYEVFITNDKSLKRKISGLMSVPARRDPLEWAGEQMERKEPADEFYVAKKRRKK